MRTPEGLEPPYSTGFPYATLHEVNERCIELLVNAARAEARPPFPLVHQVRDALRSSRPEGRRLAAQRAFLLVDLEFRNAQWWRALRTQPDRHWRTPAWRGAFPRRSAIPLTRATLMLAWYGIQADLGTACVVLGMTHGVAKTVAGMQLPEIDRIADRAFRHLQPRWQDRPGLWRSLLLDADTPVSMTRLNLQGLRLLTGELLETASRHEE